MKNREIELLDLQLITTYIFVGSLFISILLTYDDKIRIKENRHILSQKDSAALSIFNRSLVVLLGISFLYINYENRKLGIIKQEDIKPYNLQLTASGFSIISSLIVLYVVITSGNYSIIVSGENPSL